MLYTPQTPLNRLVDAAPAESEVARRFAALVDSVVAPGTVTPPRPAVSLRQLAALRAQLLLWQTNDARLQMMLVLKPALREYGPLSTQLAAVSKLLLERLNQLQTGQTASAAWLATARTTLQAAQAPAGQAELAIVRAARKLAGI
jgi:hexosaminidase